MPDEFVFQKKLSFQRADSNMRSEAVSNHVNLPYETSYEPQKHDFVPAKDNDENRSRKLTLMSSKMKEIELEIKKIEEKKDHIRTSMIVWKGANIFSEQFKIPDLKTPQKQVQSTFKMIEKKMNGQNHSKPLLVQFFLFMLTNLFFLSFIVSLDLYMKKSSDSYLSSLDMTLQFSKNYINLKKLHTILLLDIALNKSMISLDRYSNYSSFVSTPSQSVLYTSLNRYIPSKYTEYVDIIRDTSKNMNRLMDETNFAALLDHSKAFQASTFLKKEGLRRFNTSFYSAHFGILVNKISALMEHLTSQDEAGLSGLDTDLVTSSITSLSNDLSPNVEKFREEVYSASLSRFNKKLNTIQYMVYSLIGLLLFQAILTTLAFKRIVTRYTQIYLSFSTMTTEEFVERICQLRKVQAKMKEIQDNRFYILSPLDHEYVLEIERRETGKLNKSITDQSNPMHSSRSLFTNIWLPVFSFIMVYFILACVSISAGFLLASKQKEIAWMDLKKSVSEQMANSYLTLSNSLLQYMVAGTSIDLESTPPLDYLLTFERRVEEQMEKTNSLISRIHSSSKSVDSELFSFYETIYDSSVCFLVPTRLKSFCETIDNNYSQKGISQIEKRLASFLKESHSLLFASQMSPTTLMNKEDYSEIELAGAEIYSSVYESILLTVLTRMHTHAQSEVRNSFSTLSTVVVCCIITVMVSVWVPLRAFSRMTRIVYFSFHLISLNTYRSNYHIKHTLNNIFDIKV